MALYGRNNVPMIEHLYNFWDYEDYEILHIGSICFATIGCMYYEKQKLLILIAIVFAVIGFFKDPPFRVRRYRIALYESFCVMLFIMFYFLMLEAFVFGKECYIIRM